MEPRVPGVLLVQSSHAGRRFTQFLLCDDRALLVDSGMSGWVADRIEPQLAAAGVSLRRVRFVLTTHADVDHYGGNGELREAIPGVVMLAHRVDAPLVEDWECMVRERLGVYDRFGLGYSQETMDWLLTAAGASTRIDVLLQGGEVLRIGKRREVEIVHLPGHSAGLVGVWDRSNRVLIASDAALGVGMVTESGTVEGPPPYFEVRTYRRSLLKMLSIDFDWLLLSHQPVMDRVQGQRFLKESLAHTHAMEAAILECLAGRWEPVPFRGIYEAIAERFGPYTSMPNELVAPIRAHLEDLRRRGQVKADKERDSGKAVWQACAEGVV